MKKIISFICFVTYSQIFCSNPLVLEKATDGAISSRQREVEQLNIVDDILDNSQRKSGVVWRPFKEGEGDIKGIVLHYTVTQTYELTKRAYYNAGVSAHYTINFNGVIFKNVPDGAIAFHAGASGFDGNISLNRFYVGIEQVHPGYVEKGKEYTGVWSNTILG